MSNAKIVKKQMTYNYINYRFRRDVHSVQISLVIVFTWFYRKLITVMIFPFETVVKETE